MTFNSPLRLVALIAAVLAFAGVAAAQGVVYGAGTTFSNLAVSANVQTALSLEISSDPAGVSIGGSAGSGAFTLDFGNVNGLGLGTPAANVTKTAVAGGFLYTTPIKITPSFSGFAPATATVSVNQPAADGAAAVAMAREGSTAAINAATVPAAVTAFTAAATTGTVITRYVGVKVLNGNAGATFEAGVRNINLIYTISVP